MRNRDDDVKIEQDATDFGVHPMTQTDNTPSDIDEAPSRVRAPLIQRSYGSGPLGLQPKDRPGAPLTQHGRLHVPRRYRRHRELFFNLNVLDRRRWYTRKEQRSQSSPGSNAPITDAADKRHSGDWPPSNTKQS